MKNILVRARQRLAFRRAIRLECEVVREEGFKLLGRRAIDLSTDGMCVLTDMNVLTGEDVLVTFRAPFTRTWVDAEATVARVIHGRRPGDRGRCLGLHFERLDEVARALLRTNLRGLPPPIPLRAPRVDYAATAAAIAAT